MVAWIYNSVEVLHEPQNAEIIRVSSLVEHGPDLAAELRRHAEPHPPVLEDDRRDLSRPPLAAPRVVLEVGQLRRPQVRRGALEDGLVAAVVRQEGDPLAPPAAGLEAEALPKHHNRGLFWAKQLAAF